MYTEYTKNLIYRSISGMEDLSWLSRTQLLIGEEKLKHLTTRHVMVVGLGGVGSYA
jgi:tRNA A37 threonylcarbamoyladenosine dehydratase